MSYLEAYPDPVYEGNGEVSATHRPAAAPHELGSPPGNTVDYLATGGATDGGFGLYRWNFGGHVSRADADHAISFASRDQPVAATDYVTTAFTDFAPGGNVPPLLAVATWDHWDVAGKLLAAGADPNARAGSLTPVMAAAAYDHPVTLKLLLEGGGAPTSPDPRVADPVVIAGQRGATEVVTLLRAPR